jgi:hypothetical protein
VIIGFFTAYPVNAWLMAMGLKHGMGTDRSSVQKRSIRRGPKSRRTEPAMSMHDPTHHSTASTSRVVPTGAATKTTAAYACNAQVPGLRIRVTEGRDEEMIRELAELFQIARERALADGHPDRSIQHRLATTESWSYS